MAPRTFWKGYLKLSLVTCPVTMEPARTAGEAISATLFEIPMTGDARVAVDAVKAGHPSSVTLLASQ